MGAKSTLEPQKLWGGLYGWEVPGGVPEGPWIPAGCAPSQAPLLISEGLSPARGLAVLLHRAGRGSREEDRRSRLRTV